MNWFPAIGLALAIGAPLPKEKVEIPNIVGEWVATGSIRDDHFVPVAEPTSLVFEFQVDGQFRTRLNGEESDVGTYKVGPAKSARPAMPLNPRPSYKYSERSSAPKNRPLLTWAASAAETPSVVCRTHSSVSKKCVTSGSYTTLRAP